MTNTILVPTRVSRTSGQKELVYRAKNAVSNLNKSIDIDKFAKVIIESIFSWDLFAVKEDGHGNTSVHDIISLMEIGLIQLKGSDDDSIRKSISSVLEIISEYMSEQLTINCMEIMVLTEEKLHRGIVNGATAGFAD